MTAELDQETPLPRGCSLTKAKGVFAFVGKLLKPITEDRWTLHEWERRYKAREDRVKDIMDSFSRMAISGEMESLVSEYGLELDFDVKDPETGFSYRTILAQGLRDIHEGRLVLVTKAPVVVVGESTFAVGGALGFGVQLGKSITEVRQVKAQFIGVALDIFSKHAKPVKNDDLRWIPAETVFSIFDAVTVAESAYQQIKKEGKLEDFFTQEEMDRALNWVYFGQTEDRI